MSESPAEVIRRAAALMRERVQELPPSPWRGEGRDVTATQDYEGDGSWDWDRGYIVAACPRQDEAEHIASWSPPVALAAANLLEDRAGQYDQLTEDGYGTTGEWFLASEDPFIVLARAYLGETP